MEKSEIIGVNIIPVEFGDVIYYLLHNAVTDMIKLGYQMI